MKNLPSGTVTFLFTDIEGSTKLAQSYPDDWESLRARHHNIVKSAIESNNGYVFQIIGDAFCASFHTAGDALRAAAQAQIELHKEDWGEASVKVRMGINTGAARAGKDIDHSGGYKGYTAMARVQRLMSAGHGGQVLISLATEELVRDDLPESVALRDMGEFRLKDLIRPEHIHQLVISGLPSEFPPLKTLDAYRHNLPVQLTSFIGREEEMREIEHAIGNYLLVSLTGIGGTGKTRLALQVAANMIDKYPDGVWFVELATIDNPELIPQTILSALGIPEQPGVTPKQLLMDYLRGKHMLLVLDNCEHVIEASAKLVQSLLGHAPELRILTTSREALGVKGELIRQVPSLSLPDTKQGPIIEPFSQFEAVQLFIERALLVQPDFAVTNDNAPYVAQICSRLDGIPLAIELAAARVRALSVDQISERLNDRFRLLTDGSRMALERHQTLRATIDWSYNLLSTDEKLLLGRLSVFVGGWTLEAAEQICGGIRGDIEVLDTLTRLLEKSLINLNGSRYRMLETTQQFALEKLYESDDAPATHDKHAAYFLEFSRHANIHWARPNRIEQMERFEKEVDNFRAAIDWQIEKQNTESALNLLDSLGSGWGWRGLPNEMEAWLNKVRSLPNINAYPEPYVNILNFMGAQFLDSINISQNKAYLEEAREIGIKLGTEGEIRLARTLQILGDIILHSEDDTSIAQSLFERSYELYQHNEDKRGIAWSMLYFGNLASFQGRFEKAEKQYTISLSKFQELGDKDGMAYALSALGDQMRVIGDYDRAVEFWKQNLEIFREINKRSAFIYPMTGLAWASLRQGEHGQAQNLFKEALGLSNEYGNKNMMIYCISGLASVLGSIGKPKQAARLFGAVELLLEGAGKLEPADQKDYDHYLAVVRGQLDETAFEKAWTKGRTMTMEQAIEYAFEETNE